MNGKVTVRIWYPTESCKTGHVSLETRVGGDHGDGHYISFYPGRREGVHQETDKQAQLNPRGKGYLNEQYAADLNLPPGTYDERQATTPPDTIIDFFSLNAEAINEKYERFRAGDMHWEALSFHPESRVKPEQVHNCCTLVLSLLKEGGITRFLPGDDERHFANIDDHNARALHFFPEVLITA